MSGCGYSHSEPVGHVVRYDVECATETVVHEFAVDSFNMFDLAPRLYGVGHMAKRHDAFVVVYAKADFVIPCFRWVVDVEPPGYTR